MHTLAALLVIQHLYFSLITYAQNNSLISTFLYLKVLFLVNIFIILNIVDQVNTPALHVTQ